MQKHPTAEQALVAAQDPNTLPEVLLRLDGVQGDATV